jgi:ferredoxin
MNEGLDDLLALRERLLVAATKAGCNAVGVCNRAGLEGGPPSTDLTRQLAGARSAIVVAFPIDEASIDLYMGKIDHYPYKKDTTRTNEIVNELLSEMAIQLRELGYEAENVNPANTIADGQSDVMPQNEWQEKAAERNPATEADIAMRALPLISQRHLAAASGVGFFGMSGNILTESHGATVTLGALITTADLPPTPVLPPEVNYCDECNWCGNVCPTRYMSRTEFTTVKMGDHGHHKYAAREHHSRCASHMMGATGLSRDGKFSSWGPARKQLPDNDGELMQKMGELLGDLEKRPPVPSGYDEGRGMTGKMAAAPLCSACNLVCHPEKKVRAKRMKMWLQGGVTVQREDGTIETMPLDEARAHLDAMTAEQRALYEDMEETGTQERTVEVKEPGPSPQ